MQLMVAIGLAVTISTGAVAAEDPKKAYNEAVFCAAVPIALRDNPSPDGFGGTPSSQSFAEIIAQTYALAVSFGEAARVGRAAIDVDIRHQATKLSNGLIASSLEDRHRLQTMLGRELIVCAMEKK